MSQAKVKQPINGAK